MTDPTLDLDAIERVLSMARQDRIPYTAQILDTADALVAEVRRLRLTGEAIENGREYQRGRAESVLAELGVLRAQRDAALAENERWRLLQWVKTNERLNGQRDAVLGLCEKASAAWHAGRAAGRRPPSASVLVRDLRAALGVQPEGN